MEIDLKKLREKPLKDLVEIKRLIHRKYNDPAYIDVAKPFLYWKQMEVIVTKEIVRRKQIISQLNGR